MTTDARVLRDALRRLLVAYRAFDEAERPCGTPLPIPHAWALLELRWNELTVTELAERLSIDRTNVSRLCTRMEELGELKRTVHPEDGRVRVLTLTAKGKKAANNIDNASAAHFAKVLTQVDGTLPVVQTLLSITDAMIEVTEKK